MEQYISKSALVAEIKRRKELVSDPILLGNDLMIGEGNAYFNLLSFIDTLEVKEVDLEEEIKEVQRNYKTIEEYKGYPCTMYANSIEWIARHFFELALSLKK